MMFGASWNDVHRYPFLYSLDDIQWHPFNGSYTCTESMRSPIVFPQQPKFMTIMPPIVAGIPAANSSPQRALSVIYFNTWETVCAAQHVNCVFLCDIPQYVGLTLIRCLDDFGLISIFDPPPTTTKSDGILDRSSTLSMRVIESTQSSSLNDVNRFSGTRCFFWMSCSFELMTWSLVWFEWCLRHPFAQRYLYR